MIASLTIPVETDFFPPLSDCWYLTGPTAAGKTAISLEVAQRLNAEIISLDSMAVYRGMDLGTAKPTPAQQQRVPHHLLDLVDPTYDFSLAEYVALAHEKVREIRSRQREVLIVGGTPLYLKSLLRGLYQGPPPDWELRRAIELEVEQVGLPALRERLERVDPLSAQKLHPNDQRRMIRALEVYTLTGRPLSHQQTQFEEGRPAERCKVFTLAWPRELLHRRVDARVDSMFAAGLVEEVRQLVGDYGRLGRTASQAVGYREVLDYLAGEHSLADTQQRVKVATHQFVRRQETWFRGLSECRFLPQTGDRPAAEVAEEIVRQGSAL